MHNNSDNQFDSYVRSMMENAQEQAPAGVWDAIESRLPQSHKAPVGWWRWAGLGLAAAVAAVGTLFIVNRNTGNAPQQVVSPVIAEIPGNSPLPSDAPVEALSQEEFSNLLTQARPGLLKAGPVMQEAAGEDTETGEKQFDATGIDIPVQEVQENPVGKQMEEEKDVPTGYSFNPFSEPVRPTGNKGRTQIQLNGLVGGNEAGQSLFPHTVYMGAPSVSSDGTAISENSESIYSIPLSFGLGVRFYLSNRLSLGTGVNFSLLTRSFNGIVSDLVNGEFSAGDINHTIKYIGIPVNMYYDLLSSDYIKVYSFIGGTAEKALSNDFAVHSGEKETTYSQKVEGLQWSANLGLGVQFNLSNNIGLYVDPSARYYFDCNQPKSIRTRKPFMFGFEAGLRFNL